MNGEVLPGRECGTCDVCCVALTIDDPELHKLQGYRCRNLARQGGCGIYPSRPKTCRTFNCGWRLLKWVRPSLRPDRSGVLIRFTHSSGGGLGIIVTLLNGRALKADGLAETVAAAVAAGVEVHLHIPGPPGYTAGTARIDGALADAVASRDKPAVLDILRQLRRQGLAGDFVPIRSGPAPSAPSP